jgi:hypothetical protein
MTSDHSNPKQVEQRRRMKEQIRQEEEAAALERIRREVATWKRWHRKGMRRASR